MFIISKFTLCLWLKMFNFNINHILMISKGYLSTIIVAARQITKIVIWSLIKVCPSSINFHSTIELGRKRNIFQRGQSHFSWFFPVWNAFSPVEKSHFGRPKTNLSGFEKWKAKKEKKRRRKSLPPPPRQWYCIEAKTAEKNHSSHIKLLIK